MKSLSHPTKMKLSGVQFQFSHLFFPETPRKHTECGFLLPSDLKTVSGNQNVPPVFKGF